MIFIFILSISTLNGQECNSRTVFEGEGGEIASHNNYGVNSYANGLDCTYSIVAGSSDVVAIQVRELAIENEANCHKD